jgi:thymidylate synthase (FAD)
MKIVWVKPEIHLVGQMRLDAVALATYLRSIGCSQATVDSYFHDADALNIPSVAGKLCYKSFEIGLNPNVRSVRSDKMEHVVNMIKQKHGSVFEHMFFSFIFQNVSRVFTHELVRHRVGTAFSQESMRYVRPVNGIFKLTETPSMDQAEMERFETILGPALEQVEGLFNQLDKEKDFKVKKALTSKIRRLIPHGIATDIMFTCNVRQLAHINRQRTDEGAEEEIKDVFDQVSDMLKPHIPYWKEIIS